MISAADEAADGATFEQIAARAGVSRPTVFGAHRLLQESSRQELLE